MRTLALRIRAKPSIFYALLFCYFFTTCADLLNVPLLIFNLKFSHLFAMILFVMYFVKYKSFEFKREIVVLAGWMILSMCISAFFSPHKVRAVGYIGVYLLELTCFFLLPMNLMMRCDRERLLRVYYGSFVLFGVYSLMQLFASVFGIILPYVSDFWGPFVRPNSLAYETSYYALYMGLLINYMNARYLLYGAYSRFPQKCGLLIVNMMLLLSTSTSGFLSYFLFVPLALWFYKAILKEKINRGIKKRVTQLAMAFGSAVAALAIAFPKLFSKVFFKFLYIGFYNHHSAKERLDRMSGAFEAFLDYPIFGVGMGGIGPYLYIKRGFAADMSTITKADLANFDACNVFAETLGNLGLFGLFAFIYMGVVFWRRFKEVLALPLDENTRQTLACLVFSFIMCLIIVQINQSIFRSYIWVHAALIYGYILICLQKHRTR
ncbi:MAG: hypothetical protein SP1CHLAM54_15150 [Chlamydiia bacterium]|nr:hypothetical protein [Chlamydiia bacterium]MCH9616405.1 hypothetical protein [Chlamydiia bacterium]MCH9629609.1 hypothetical protein [Chlamydiia bacterium]